MIYEKLVSREHTERRRIPKAVKVQVFERFGKACINCGSIEDIELHHIVPLEIGGNDIWTNLVPLCRDCHTAVTHHALVLQHAGRYRKSGGRPRKIPDNYEEILWKYAKCEIGSKECKQMLGLSENNNITDNPWYRDFVEKNNIDKVKNNIDIKTARKGVLTAGEIVGWINYKDGSTEKCIWQMENRITKQDKQISFMQIDKNKWLAVDNTEEEIPKLDIGFINIPR